MADQNVSFEEIERRIDSLDLKAFQAGGAKYFTADVVTRSPGDVLKRICEIYRAIRGILVALENFPLIPKKWRDAIKTFRELMDQLCPEQ